VTDRQTW